MKRFEVIKAASNFATVAPVELNARASEFNHLRAQRLENFKFNFQRAVVTKIFSGVRASLQTVSADDLLRRQMLDDKMVAHGVERVFVETAGVGLRETLVEF